MIAYRQVLLIHEPSMKKEVPACGMTGLLAAPARPYATFEGKPLYNYDDRRGRGYRERIIMNHRSPTAISGPALRINDAGSGHWIDVPQSGMYPFIIDLATAQSASTKPSKRFYLRVARNARSM